MLPALVALLLTAGQGAEIEKDAILVLTLRPLGISQAEARAVTDRVSHELASLPQFRVVGYGDLEAVALQQQHLAELGCSDDQCLVELSRLADTSMVLSGSVGRVGDLVVLNVSLFDSGQAHSKGSASVTTQSLEELPGVIPQVLAEVLGFDGESGLKARYRLPEGKEISLAVLDLKPLGISETVAANLTQILAVEIKEIERAKVISQDDIKSMLSVEANKQLLGCESDESCLAEIGGALGVEKLVVGHAGMLGESYVVSLRLVDARKVLVESRVSEVFSGVEDQLLPAIRQAGRKLLGIEDDSPGGLALSGDQADAEVFLDNEPIGHLPMPALSDLSPGRHKIQVSKGGFVDWKSDVFVVPATTVPVWAQMQEEPPGWYETWWFWTAAGVIVAGAVVGTVYALQPKDQHENSDVHVSVLGGGTP